MAPEVIRGQGSSPKSDVWSLGATVWEMAAAAPPLAHLEAMAALFHIGNCNDIGEPPESLGPDGVAFVKLCMRTEKADRPTISGLLVHPFLSAAESL